MHLTFGIAPMHGLNLLNWMVTKLRWEVHLRRNLPVLQDIAAGQAHMAQLRIGTVVPKNSLYHVQLMELGETWRAAQGGGARFVVFTDGSQGGEAEIVRRMRIGQLQGGLISVVGLREIEPTISALQSLPLLFRSWEEVDYVREKMRAAME